MREKIARAIWGDRERDYRWEQMSRNTQEQFYVQADAVIEALTKEFVGNDLCRGCPKIQHCGGCEDWGHRAKAILEEISK